MTVALPLERQKEAKLVALAHAKGMTADALVCDAMDQKEPTRSLRGWLAKYGPAPISDDRRHC